MLSFCCTITFSFRHCLSQRISLLSHPLPLSFPTILTFGAAIQVAILSGNTQDLYHAATLEETTEWIDDNSQSATTEEFEEKLSEIQEVVNPITSKTLVEEGIFEVKAIFPAPPLQSI
jgi:hypothetical protein